MSVAPDGVAPSAADPEAAAARCPTCAATVRPHDPWCSQCYTDLRPKEPAEIPVQEPTAAEHAGQVEATEQAAELEPAAVFKPVTRNELVEQSAQPEQGEPTEQNKAITWPCGRCGTAVPIEDDTCPNCFARFLDAAMPLGERPLLDRLPRDKRKSSTTLLLVVGGGALLTGVFVGLLALFALII